MTGLVTAVHLYVTDLDRSTDFYSRLLGYGPAAAYDEGDNAHSAFFVLEQQTFLVLTWDTDRGREVGGAVRLELAADEIESEVERLETHGITGMVTRTRFGTRSTTSPTRTATWCGSGRPGRCTPSKALSKRLDFVLTGIRKDFSW